MSSVIYIQLYEIKTVTLLFHLPKSRQNMECTNKEKEISHAGNRTRIGRVRACYPNQLDYMGPISAFQLAYLTD